MGESVLCFEFVEGLNHVFGCPGEKCIFIEQCIWGIFIAKVTILSAEAMSRGSFKVTEAIKHPKYTV